jgi:hypothetical protein
VWLPPARSWCRQSDGSDQAGQSAAIWEAVSCP